MEMRGITVDRQILSRLSGDFAQTLARLEAEIQEIAGEKFNIGSPKQIGDILFGKMGLPGAKKTATGPMVDRARTCSRNWRRQGTRCRSKILEWRQLAKLKSTYTDALPELHAPARPERVHTSYALAATTTGRLSSSDPNLQNIPIRTEAGPQDPHRLRRRRRATRSSRPTTARSSCASSPTSPTSRSSGRPSPTASTSTP